MWQKTLVITSLLLAGCAAQPQDQVAAQESISAQDHQQTSTKAQEPAKPVAKGDAFNDYKPQDGARSTANDARDPFEPVNRAAWFINYDVLDPYAVRPVAHAYADYVAVPIREGVQNVVLNLEEPASFVNHVITGDAVGAGTNLVRFGVNSTLGLLGFFDVAEKMTLASKPKDFSQVLGQMGVGNGPFLMVPLYGPTTLRQLSGDVVDGLYFPYDAMTVAMRAGKWALNGLYERSELIDREPIIDNALDPYGLTKDFYLQYQDAKIGKEAAADADDDLSEFMDEIDE
ncbi:MlaA family lipoprotein [Oceanisphaera sp. W20_SRM_FM3]|uniref:MlaA family lipoprotein n=1 Tax=Oceanisphaera sp. W20_SRM_FM3 TaxID=3240267 RepID=UPI003F9E69DF